METTKAPIHFLKEMSAIGHNKHVALFLSLKKIYESGHIHDFRKLDLSKIAYRISRPTYLKYLRHLEALRLVWSDGKGGMNLAGQDRILRLYPLKPKEKLKYIHLPNDKKLKENIEKLVLSNNIQGQIYMIMIASHNALPVTEKKIIKTVRGVKKTYTINPEYDTSLTNKNLAKLIGLNSHMTGYRRQKKWDKEGFIEKVNRLEELGNINDASVRLKLQEPILYRTIDNIVYRILANEIQIKDRKLGRKVIEESKNYKGYITLSSLYLEWF